ncbi:MAG: mechanosensitive ion channel family protein [Cyclobacteriaceae bacterium]|nr:mechanosensitive ion channel family protein [Cyclobacteriaceae bacterium]
MNKSARFLFGIKTLTVFCFFVFFTGDQVSVFGQESAEITTNESATTYSLRTPFHTLETYLRFTGDEERNLSLATRTFPPAYAGVEEAQLNAQKLRQALDGRGIIIDLSVAPKERSYTDTTENAQVYYFTNEFSSLYLERADDGRWYFSEESFKAIPQIHREVFPFGTDRLLTLLPKLGTNEYFGLQTWQLIALLGLIFIAVAVHKVFSYILKEVIIVFLKKAGYEQIANKYYMPVARPLSYMVIFPTITILLPVLQLNVTFTHYITITIYALIPLFGTVFFYRLVDVLSAYLQKMAEKTESTLDDQLVPLVKKVLRIFVIVVGGLAILSNLNFNILPLITGLSIGGLAVALAAQDTLKNFFGSVMIFIDKPFQIGDWITTGGVDGTVEEVGFRATRIRTFRDSLIYIPNGKLADTDIDNHGKRRYRRFFTTITITYDTPAEVVDTFVNGLRGIVERHPDTRKDFYNIFLNDLGAHSLNIMFYVFFPVPTWGEELRVRHELLLDIINLAEELNVRFAFPTQTLHMETFPDKPSLTPEFTESGDQLKNKVTAFLKGNKSSTSN